MPSSQPQPLSLELSVRTAVPVRRKALLFGRRVLSYRGKACLCTGDIFPRIPGGYKTAPRTPHFARSPSHPDFCAVPKWARGSGGCGCRRRSEADLEFLSSAPRGKEPAWPTAETWFPQHWRVCSSGGALRRALDEVIPPHCAHLLSLQNRKFFFFFF